MTLKVKLFLLRIGLGLLMVLAIGVSSYHIAAGNIEQKMLRNLQFDSSIISDRLDLFLEDLQETLLAMGTDPAVEKYNLSGQEEVLIALFQREGGNFNLLSFLDKRGREAVKIVGGAVSRDFETFAANPFYQKALANPNQVIFTDIVQAKGFTKPVLELYLYNTNFFDQPFSFLRAVVSLDSVHRILGKISIQEAGLVLLVNSASKIVDEFKAGEQGNDYRAGTIARGLSRSKFLDQMITEAARANHGIVSRIRLFNETYEAALTPLKTLPWHAVVAQSKDSLLSGVREIRNTIILVALAIVLIGELISRWLGLQVTEPIEQFNALAAEIAGSGRLSDRINWRSKDELGRLAGSFNSMLDKLENLMGTLTEERQFSRDVISSMADMLVVANDHNEIISVNDSFCNLLGYQEKEIFGMPLATIFAGNVIPLDESLLWGNGRDGAEFRIETAFQTRNGEIIPVDLVKTVLTGPQGDVHGIVCVAKDIRMRKKLEEERQQAEHRMKKVQQELFHTEKMAVVGQMAGMVAHEVLNPISAVNVRVNLDLQKEQELQPLVGILRQVVADWQANATAGDFASYFEKNGAKDLELLEKIAVVLERKQAERLEDFEFIEKLIQRIIKTIDGFREMSRQKTTIEEVALRRVVEEVLDDMRDGIAKRKVIVETDFSAEPVIRADFMEIYSIVSNIVRNGLQAMDKKDRNAERRLRLQLSDLQGEKACLLIEDSGIGMDAEGVARVFEPGFTSKGRQGTGIGMSFSRKIARKYGGDIVVLASEPGKGTVFEVSLAYGETRSEDR